MFKFFAGSIFGSAATIGLVTLFGAGLYLGGEWEKENEKNKDRTIDI